MASFITDCPICGQAISSQTPFIATSGCAFPPEHPLFAYCDAALHQECLLHWPHRREFATAYFERDGTYRLLEAEEWWIGTGPFVYGPNGRIDFPYYVAARFRDWPIRLYARFLDWPAYVARRDWKAGCIPELNQYIASVINLIPADPEGIQDLLLEPLLNTMATAPEHHARYVAVLSLGLLGTSRIRSAADKLVAASQDLHGSVRQAASALLKRLAKEG